MSESPMMPVQLEEAPVVSRGRYCLSAFSRKIEDWLPVTESYREKLRERQVVLRCLVNTGIALLTLLALFGLYAIYLLLFDDVNNLRTLPIIGQQMNDLNSGIKRLGLRNAGRVPAQWQAPADASKDRLHGILGRKPEGWTHDFDRSLKEPLDRLPVDQRSKECKAKDYGTAFPSTSVVIIFCNEPFETLMRSVHSVLNTSPPSILREIILVDDGSDAAHVKLREKGGSGLLEDYIALLPPKVRLIRMGRRSGIVQARLAGIRAAAGEAFVILDSHIEAQPGWLEALVYPIEKDKSTVVMPHIDGIDKHSYELKKGGVGCTLGMIWKVMEHSFTPDQYSPPDRLHAKPDDYVTSPTMAGGLFAAHRDYFLSLGGYDEEMSGWGAENVEFSLRLWQCGGKLLCTECSRVYHIFGGGKFYTTGGHSTTSNRMRTMAAWMDEYADLAWHVLGRPSFHEIGNITNMLELRKKHDCKDFKWFLDNVWPESEIHNLPEDVPFLGPLISYGEKKCLPAISRGTVAATLSKCGSGRSRAGGEFTFWRREGRISPASNDETCLLHSGKWDWCYYVDIRRFELKRWTEKEAERDALKKALVEEYGEHMFEGHGELVLVTIRDTENDRCLTAIERGGVTKTEMLPCEDDFDPEQVWGWTKYELDPFWKELHDE